MFISSFRAASEILRVEFSVVYTPAEFDNFGLSQYKLLVRRIVLFLNSIYRELIRYKSEFSNFDVFEDRIGLIMKFL